MSEEPLPDKPTVMTAEQDLLPRAIRTSSVPKKGQRATTTLSEHEKQTICLFYDLQEIQHFEAKTFLEKKTTTKFRLSGIVRGEVVQTCVLSLKPVKKLIEEEIDLTVVPASELEKYMESTDDVGLLMVGLDGDVPDTYDHEVIELGGFILEHFALGLDPYPRAEDAKIDQSSLEDDGKVSAFAGLAALKDKMEPR